METQPRQHISNKYNTCTVVTSQVYIGFKILCKSKDSRVYMDRVKRIWYLSPMRAAKVQASLRIRAVSPEPSLLAHISSEEELSDRKPDPWPLWMAGMRS